MTRQEALNVAWHARVNGLGGIKPEYMLGAFAVLESLAATIARVEALREHFYTKVGALDEFTAYDIAKRLEVALKACANSGPDTLPISAPGGHET